MQHKQMLARTGHDGIGVAVIVAKLNKGRFLAEHFDDCTNLTARKPRRGHIGQQRHRINNGWFAFLI